MAKRWTNVQSDPAHGNNVRVEAKILTVKEEFRKNANKYDGTVHKDGKRYFSDGSEVDGVNDWISHKNK